MNRTLLLCTLRAMGAEGNAAASLIEAQAVEITSAHRKMLELNGELGRSEQRMRDLNRHIERLKKELLAAKAFA